jgi:hypothetical protein
VFRRRVRDAERRHCWCQACFNLYSKNRRRARRLKRTGKFLQHVNLFWAEPSHVEALTRAAIQRHDGLERLVEDMHQWREQASAAGKHHLVGRFYVAICHLMEAANQAKAERQPKLDDMATVEVEAHLKTIAHDYVRDHPEMLLEAAIASGWTMTPPEDTMEDEGDEDTEDTADDQPS